MATESDIVNLALSKLGQTRITALTDDTKEARLANATYDIHRDYVIRDHLWNFAMTRALLDVNATAPSWGFDFAYDLPTTPAVLRVTEVSSEKDYDWRREGNQILSDHPGNTNSKLPIVYIAQITDTTLFDAQFVEALAVYMAAEWCENLTGSTTLRQQLTELYRLKISEARSMDGQEGSPRVLESCAWVDSRFRGGRVEG